MLSSTCTNPSGSGIRGNAAGEGGVAVGRKPGSSEEVGELTTVDSEAGRTEPATDSDAGRTDPTSDFESVVAEMPTDSDAGVAELSDDSSGMAMDDEAAAAEAVS